MTCQRTTGAALCAALPLLSACGGFDEIRVRDRTALLYEGRAQVHAPRLTRGDRDVAFGIGGELGGFGAAGDYDTSSGTKDYQVSAGYAAVLFETRVGAFRILPKVGIGYDSTRADTATSTVVDEGVDLMTGLEGRWSACEWCDVVVRRAQLWRVLAGATFTSAGVELRPAAHVGIDVAYGVLEGFADFPAGGVDVVDVRAQGVALGMTLHF